MQSLPSLLAWGVFSLGLSLSPYLNSVFRFSLCFSLPIFNCNCYDQLLLCSSLWSFHHPAEVRSLILQPHVMWVGEQRADDRINLQVSPSFCFWHPVICHVLMSRGLFVSVVQSFSRLALSNLNYFTDNLYIRRYLLRKKTFKCISFENSWIQQNGKGREAVA